MNVHDISTTSICRKKTNSRCVFPWFLYFQVSCLIFISPVREISRKRWNFLCCSSRNFYFVREIEENSQRDESNDLNLQDVWTISVIEKIKKATHVCFSLISLISILFAHHRNFLDTLEFFCVPSRTLCFTLQNEISMFSEKNIALICFTCQNAWFWREIMAI